MYVDNDAWLEQFKNYFMNEIFIGLFTIYFNKGGIIIRIDGYKIASNDNIHYWGTALFQSYSDQTIYFISCSYNEWSELKSLL